MTAIRIKCPTCGEVDLSPEELSLYVPTAEERVSYAFTCPECTRTVERSTTRKTAALLIAAGVEPLSTPGSPEPQLPPEDRSPDPDAPALTLDDLIEFHLLLQDERALTDLLQH